MRSGLEKLSQPRHAFYLVFVETREQFLWFAVFRRALLDRPQRRANLFNLRLGDEWFLSDSTRGLYDFIGGLMILEILSFIDLHRERLEELGAQCAVDEATFDRKGQLF
jgi:hypothetical protein